MYDIQVIEIDPVWTAVVRAAVPVSELSQFVPAACGEVWAFIRAEGVPAPDCHIALYMPDGTVEVGVEVAQEFRGGTRVQCSRLPGGRVAHARHLGPYGELPCAHAALRQWCAAAGEGFSGVCWERYGHWQEAWNNDPSKVQTDVYYLLSAPAC